MAEIVLSKFPRHIANNTATPGTKVCKTCPEEGEQPLEMFSKQNGTLDGRAAKCKACARAEYKQKMDERRMIGL